jgi:hypothetical protein
LFQFGHRTFVALLGGLLVPLSRFVKIGLHAIAKKRDPQDCIGRLDRPVNAFWINLY